MSISYRSIRMDEDPAVTQSKESYSVSNSQTVQSPQGKTDTVAKVEMKKKSEAVKRQREIIHAREEETKFSARIGELIVPLIVLGVLALIVSFVLIPSATQIVENRKQSAQLQEQLDRKKAKVSVLNTLSIEDLERDLRTVSKVIKDDMNVAELASEIDFLAISNNLTPQSEEAANQGGALLPSSEEEIDWKPENADSITGPFTFSGRFQDICSFISDLRLRSSTILSLGAVNISVKQIFEGNNFEASSSGEWIVSLSVKGYTVSPRATASIDDQVSVFVQEGVMEEIEERAAYEHSLFGEGEEQSDAANGEDVDDENAGADDEDEEEDDEASE